MNRRNFLKSVGVLSILGLSNITFANNKKEIKWISFKDQMPKVGQKLIRVAISSPENIRKYGNNYINYISFNVGEVSSDMNASKWRKRLKYDICFENLFTFSSTYNKDKYNLAYIGTMKNFNFDSLKWFKIDRNSSIVHYPNLCTRCFCMVNDNCYWMPISSFDNIPKKLPHLPSLIY